MRFRYGRGFALYDTSDKKIIFVKPISDNYIKFAKMLKDNGKLYISFLLVSLLFYQHPTPTPKSPLTPRGDFDFLFAAGCFGSGVRFTLQSSTRLRYRSLQSLLMLALCRGKAMGLTILFPMQISALPKKRTVGSKPPTAFSSSRCYHGETLHCGYKWEKEDMGTTRPQTLRPPLRTVGGFALRGGTCPHGEDGWWGGGCKKNGENCKNA